MNKETKDQYKPFSEQRRKWRKEWNEQTKIKDWYEYLEHKINSLQ